MKVDGLHHVTAITADIDANLEFYGRLLGLRLVWQGVNADDPEMRHIAYGDERGSPGSIVTGGLLPHRGWASPPSTGTPSTTPACISPSGCSPTTSATSSGRPLREGPAMRLHCAEVSSPGVKALFIDVRVEGFFLERFNDRGELVGTTQHDTMDEAMWQADSEYEIAEWRSCPEDVDPVEFIRAASDP